MSQNAHTLLLFFRDKDSHRNSLRLFRALEAEDQDAIQDASERSGLDISEMWEEQWFNQSVTSKPSFIRLDYETGTSEDLPLELLQGLFSAGLRVACYEVFFDQVGEFSQAFFKDGKQVSPHLLYNASGQLKSIVDEQFECSEDDLELDDIGQASSITELIDARESHKEDVMALVGDIRAIAKMSAETGQHPMEILEETMIGRAAWKGIFHGLGFGVVTVLLFKGIWLWIGLSVLLTLGLMMYYVSEAKEEFKDDVDASENEEASENDDHTGDQ